VRRPLLRFPPGPCEEQEGRVGGQDGSPRKENKDVMPVVDGKTFIDLIVRGKNCDIFPLTNPEHLFYYYIGHEIYFPGVRSFSPFLKGRKKEGFVLGFLYFEFI
jgi:hypothetical protein